MEFNTDLTRNFLGVFPEILMTILVLVVILIDLYTPPSRRRVTGYIAGVGMLLIALVAVLMPSGGETVEEQLVLGGTIRTDSLANIFRFMAITVGGLTCLMGMGDPRLRYKSEFFAITIIATIGASLLGAAADLVMIFVALETLSISLYILTGFVRPAKETDSEPQKRFAYLSSESSVKYFLFGAFTSAFFLYGLSLVYGFTGHTNIYLIGQQLSLSGFETAPVLVALVLVIVGFGFKISAVPFHFWTPDVYEGAPTPATSFISTVSKAASFAVLVRFLLAVFPPFHENILPELEGAVSFSEWWVQLFAIFSVVTMTLGNVVALQQSNIKRLIAYSSIAQAGYALMGVAAISTDPDGQGVAAVAFYMLMYVMTNTLMFAALIIFTNETGSEQIKDMAGLSRRNPWIALGITVALLSLGGIPPAAGFIGKFLLFRAAVDSGLIWLAMIGVINAIISLYYYLVVVKVIYVDESPDQDKEITLPAPYGFVIGSTTLAVIILGTVFTPFVNWANDAGADLFLSLF